ncbi:hypothetical protein L7F22_058953 [Adiantum nelumboides]|nr:hypothetical protein [Adiantum nelumboides]
MVIHQKSAPYHPQANGQAESMNKILVTIITKIVSELRASWDQKLHLALWEYRVGYKTSIDITPFNMVYGIQVILPLEFSTLRVAKDLEWTRHELSEQLEVLEKLDETRLRAVASIYTQKRNMKSFFDQHEIHKEFATGDCVLMYTLKQHSKKLKKQENGPYVIHDISSSGAIKLATLEGEEILNWISGCRLKNNHLPLTSNMMAKTQSAKERKNKVEETKAHAQEEARIRNLKCKKKFQQQRQPQLGSLTVEICSIIYKLAELVRWISQKEIKTTSIDSAQKNAVELVCMIEKYLPPSMLTIQVHLLVHVVDEKARPEGSMAEGWIVQESLVYITEWIAEFDKETQESPMLWRLGEDERLTTDVAHGGGTSKQMDTTIEEKINRFCMLHHPTMDKWLTTYETAKEERYDARRAFRARQRGRMVWYPSELEVLPRFMPLLWLHQQLTKAEEEGVHVSLEEWEFSRGCSDKSYSAAWSCGRHFRVDHIDKKRVTFDSGVMAKFEQASRRRATYQNIVIAEMQYFGLLKEIINADYRSFTILISYVQWFKVIMEGPNATVRRDVSGFIEVDSTKPWSDLRDTFVLPEHCEQVIFYPKPFDERWWYVIEVAPRGTMSDHNGSGSRSPSLSDAEVNRFLERLTPEQLASVASRAQQSLSEQSSPTQSARSAPSASSSRRSRLSRASGPERGSERGSRGCGCCGDRDDVDTSASQRVPLERGGPSGRQTPSERDTAFEGGTASGRQTPSSSRVQEIAKHTPSGTQESTPEGTLLAHRRQLPEGYSYLVDASGAIIMTPEGKEVISAMRRLCRQVFRHIVMQTFAAQRQDLKDYVIDTLYHDFPVPTPGTTGRAASRLERSLGAQHGLAWVIELLDRRCGESPYTESLTRAELPDPPQL